MQHHIDQMTSTHNLIGTIKNSYTPHKKTKTFHTTMLLKTKVGEIGVRLVFDERKKHDPNSTI